MEEQAKREWALKQYDTLMRFLASEGSIYWTRSQHFLVANAVLFGFVASAKFPTDISGTPGVVFLLLLMICAAGITLSVLWRKALRAGEFWLSHWIQLLIEREQEAFGTSNLLRDFKPDGEQHYARRVAHSGAQLFFWLWILLTAFVLYAALFKIFGCGFV